MTRMYFVCMINAPIESIFNAEQRYEMAKGNFKRWGHHHFFEQKDRHTVMTDEVFYELPYGLAEKIADLLFLKNYMKRLIKKRNFTIKQTAETEGWKEFLTV